MSTDQYHEFYQLLGALREDTITPEQAEQLKSWMTQDPVALQYYIEYMTCCSDLRDIASSCPQDLPEPSVTPCCEIQDISNRPAKQETNTTAIREYAQQAYEQFKQQEKQREEELARRAYIAARRRLIVGLSSLAALIAMALFAWLTPEHRLDTISPVTQTAPPPPPMVASVNTIWEASWNLSHIPLARDSRLRASTPIQLHQGMIRLTLDQGAEILIQAPCAFTLQNANRLLVSSGIVSASVPPQAKGFVIETPNGQITDYGTEFGIIVRQPGETETQVYKGEVHLTNHKSKKPLKLFQGQTAAFDTSGNIAVKPSSSIHIPRELPSDTGLGIPGKQLNVADFIGFGNGLGSGQTNCAIDETTGQLLTQINPNGPDWKWMESNLNNFTYQPVPENPYVDGVFVPITLSGTLQVLFPSPYLYHANTSHQATICSRHYQLEQF